MTVPHCSGGCLRSCHHGGYCGHHLGHSPYVKKKVANSQKKRPKVGKSQRNVNFSSTFPNFWLLFLTICCFFDFLFYRDSPVTVIVAIIMHASSLWQCCGVNASIVIMAIVHPWPLLLQS
jgi:hypothetical protein